MSPQVQNQVDKALSRPVNPDTPGDWCLMARSHARQTMLEHILAELEGDDEGSRFGDLIEMIRNELACSSCA